MSGCSALSKGGSGDVLTGLIASLLCQGMGAALGVWLHGCEGELLAREMSAYSVSPQELVTRGLSLAFRELLEA